ncbi:MAG: T9SS type A sorting domain-containing protein, partial [Bacteroidota bacterium]|nr:T9SS type A sorting domain-containing protein [Bacteroidota bacterium]
QPLSLGLNTLTVTSVTFARTVKFQFDNGNICFDSLDLNNQSVLSSTLTDIYNLSIYPNPTKSMLFVDGNEDIISLELFSISGRSLMQVNNTNQLDISSFSTGVYFLKVNDGTTSVIKKIIKQ